MMKCSVHDNCTPHGKLRKGLCIKHYMRLRTRGATELPTDEQRFWSKVVKGYGCWTWQGAIVTNYGQCGFGGKIQYAHRVSYELLVGPIPPGLQLDHLCKNTRCVNPAHLEAVTALVNNMRSTSPSSRNAKKLDCLRGHPLSGENLKILSGGRRSCRACERLRAQRYRAQQ